LGFLRLGHGAQSANQVADARVDLLLGALLADVQSGLSCGFHEERAHVLHKLRVVKEYADSPLQFFDVVLFKQKFMALLR